jgi:hypothetical protein
MPAVAYGSPFFLLFAKSLTHAPGSDTVTIAYCLQANGLSPGDAIVLHIYDAGNPGQLWVYGSDQRIYLADSIATAPLCIDTEGGSLADGTALVLSPVDSNRTQQWYLYNSNNPSSYIGLVNAPTIVIDVDSGRLAPGNKIQTYHSINGNPNQIWTIWTASSLPWPRPIMARGETDTEARATQDVEAARAAAQAAAKAAQEAIAAAQAAKTSAGQAKNATTHGPDSQCPCWIWIPIGIASVLSLLLAMTARG